MAPRRFVLLGSIIVACTTVPTVASAGPNDYVSIKAPDVIAGQPFTVTLNGNADQDNYLSESIQTGTAADTCAQIFLHRGPLTPLPNVSGMFSVPVTHPSFGGYVGPASACAFLGDGMGGGGGAGTTFQVLPRPRPASRRVTVTCSGPSGTGIVHRSHPRACTILYPRLSFADGARLEHLRWHHWGSPTATARGIEGGFHAGQHIPITVSVFDRQRSACGLRYGRLRERGAHFSRTYRTAYC